MSKPYTPLTNRLLASLPEADYRRLLPHLEFVPLPVGKVVQDPGKVQDHVFFPISGVVSLFQIVKAGVYEQVVMVGKEGAVGIAAIVSGKKISTRAVVQIPGFAYRAKTSVIKEELAGSGTLRYLLESYMQTVVAQETQTIACNRLHAIEQQLIRWLLLGMDRHSSNDMTTAEIADLLGVGRAGVAEAAASLQAAGLISHQFGRITILDRPTLETRACECYGIVRQEIHRFLSSANAV